MGRVTAATLAPVAEVRRLRDENNGLRALIAASDPATDPAYWRALFAGAHRQDVEDAYRRGREDEAALRDRLWREAATPITRSGPVFVELERRRWGSGGRAHFADSRPGDHMGGPADWHGQNAGPHD